MSVDQHRRNSQIKQGRIYYGWVIVAVFVVDIAMTSGMLYSYGVFFKQLAISFEWNRAVTSGIYSVLIFCHGAFAMPLGWLSDRFGPKKVLVLCGFIMGLGLVLTSRITALWQIYLTLGLLAGMGSGGVFPIGMAAAARWFDERRGLALGIVSSGVGLGTVILIPLMERLISAFGWSTAYLILGLASWLVIMPSALLLKRSPSEEQRRQLPEPSAAASASEGEPAATTGRGVSLGDAFRRRSLLMLCLVFFLFCLCLQMVMVHLVNYATDLGIDSLVAATVVSVIGISSIVGRVVMGMAADRYGSNNVLAVCCLIMLLTLVFLMFTRELWMFYLFALVFGFAYGGEVPQIPAMVGHFFGLQAAAALIGLVVFGADSGGALGSWLGGRIFDVTLSYQMAFNVAAVASLLALVLALLLKKVR